MGLIHSQNNQNNQSNQNTQSVQSIRNAQHIRAIALDLALLAGHLLLYPTGLRQERPPGTAPRLPMDSPAHRPVLLLHGFIDNRSVFTPLRRSLGRHGRQHIEALNYSPLLCDLRTAAALLGRHVEEVCARTGHGQVDVIGHSLGGLIARYYVQRLRGDAHVHTLVTLGTPHSGTRIAPLLSVHPLVRQMCPDSSVITELRQPAPDCRTRFIAFWSDVDQLMIPKETARIDHPDVISQNIRVNGIGHLALAVHSSVAARIREALDAADEAPAGASSAVPDGSEASELPNVNRTSDQGSTYSQPKDDQMPFAEMLKTHGRLSLPRTAGYSRR